MKNDDIDKLEKEKAIDLYIIFFLQDKLYKLWDS